MQQVGSKLVKGGKFVRNHPQQQQQPKQQQPRQQPRPQQQQPNPKPAQEKAERKAEQKDKTFRTLKVMGLSPEFTNEDLYVGLG